MSLYVGSQRVNSVYVGSREVKRIYVGSALTYESSVDLSTLFTAETDGVWLDMSDVTTLLREDGSPVAADGDVVATVVDKSGKGHNATQAVAAKRPIYRTDGSSHWLEFDGVDDDFTIGNVSFMNNRPYTVVSPVLITQDVTWSMVFGTNVIAGGTNTSSNVELGYRESATGATTIFHGSDNANYWNTGAIPHNEIKTLTFMFHNPGGSTWRDGLLIGTGTYPQALDEVNEGFVGSSSALSSRYFRGRIYGLFLINRELTDDERRYVEGRVAMRM